MANLARLHPRAAAIIGTAANVAITEADRSGLTGRQHGNRDAFRHVFWNAWGVRQLFRADPTRHISSRMRNRSLNRAVRMMERFATANEPRGRETGANWSSTEMDLRNNRLGRSFGRIRTTSSRSGMAGQVRRAVLNNQFWIIQRRANGQHDYESGNLIRSGAGR